MNHLTTLQTGYARSPSWFVKFGFLVTIALTLLAISLPGTAFAQAGAAALLEENDTVNENFKPLIDQAKEQGLDIIILSPGQDNKTVAEPQGPG